MRVKKDVSFYSCCPVCWGILLSCFDLYQCLCQLINMTEMKLPKNFHTITHYTHPSTHSLTHRNKKRLSHTPLLHLVSHINRIFLAVGFQVDCKIRKRTPNTHTHIQGIYEFVCARAPSHGHLELHKW